jgi:hypothetical protein
MENRMKRALVGLFAAPVAAAFAAGNRLGRPFGLADQRVRRLRAASRKTAFSAQPEPKADRPSSRRPTIPPRVNAVATPSNPDNFDPETQRRL